MLVALITTAGVIISALIGAWVAMSGSSPEGTSDTAESPATPTSSAIPEARPHITFPPETGYETTRDAGVQLSGTTPELSGQSLWILDQSSDGTYFVAEAANVSKATGTWAAEDKPLGAEGEDAEIAVGLVLANDECSSRLRAELPPDGDGMLDELPRGCERVDSVTVRVGRSP